MIKRNLYKYETIKTNMPEKSMLNRLELIPNEEEVSKPMFKTREEYEQFVHKFYEAVKPELDRLRQARIRSIEQSFNHKIRSYTYSTRTNYELRN